MRKTSFTEPKDEILLAYKRVFGALCKAKETANAYESQKYSYILTGMEMCIQDKELLVKIQAEILGESKEGINSE